MLTEVLALFPSKLIHIGGDECPKGRWKACPLCQQRIREEGLKDEYQLQSYFIHRIERWMHTHGREIIGWDEILQGGISKTANIMSWNGSDPGIKAAQRGNPVIMTPKWYCYFDYSQTSDPERYEPLGNTRYVSVRQAYRLDPCDRLTLPDQKRIRGVQCNLWTEYIADIRHAQHMVLPRMAALAETGWANDRKDYNDFVRRIPALVAVYKAERPLSVRGHRMTRRQRFRSRTPRRSCDLRGVFPCAARPKPRQRPGRSHGNVGTRKRPGRKRLFLRYVKPPARIELGPDLPVLPVDGKHEQVVPTPSGGFDRQQYFYLRKLIRIPQEILEYPPFEVATVKNPVLDGKRLRNTASLHDHGRNLRVVSVEQLHTPVKHPLCGIRNSIHEDGLVPDDSEVGIALVGQGKIDMRRLEGENDADRGIPVAGRGESLLILGIADNAAPGAIGLDRFQTNPIIVQLISLRPCLRG